MRKWLMGLGISILMGTATVGLMTLANDPAPIVEEEKEDKPIVQEPIKELKGFEYYNIVDEAVANGWICGHISRCDKNQMYVYIYDPALLGMHKFNIQIYGGVKVEQADLTVVYVDKYGDKISEEVLTIPADYFKTGFVVELYNYPTGTKYVKFKDLSNFVFIND